MQPAPAFRRLAMTAFVIEANLSETIVRRAIKLGLINPDRVTARLFLFDPAEIPTLREKLKTAGLLPTNVVVPVPAPVAATA